MTPFFLARPQSFSLPVFTLSTVVLLDSCAVENWNAQAMREKKLLWKKERLEREEEERRAKDREVSRSQKKKEEHCFSIHCHSSKGAQEKVSSSVMMMKRLAFVMERTQEAALCHQERLELLQRANSMLNEQTDLMKGFRSAQLCSDVLAVSG